MSLDWGLEKVKGWRQLCWVGVFNDDGSRKMSDDGKPLRKLNPITDALIWLSMHTGLDEITAKNVDEWYVRLRQLEEIGIVLIAYPDGDNVAFRNPSYAELLQHVGLYTNNFSDKKRTKTGWRAHVERVMRESAMCSLQKEKALHEEEQKEVASGA